MEGHEEKLNYLAEVRQFKIPFFQRGYVWEEENWQQLLDQWEIGEDHDHFLGSIVINEPDLYHTNPEYGIFEIIDGQQRLTTLCILYKAVFDILKTFYKDNLEKLGEIKSKKKEILGDLDEIKIIHSRVDQNAFKDIIQGENINLDDIVLDSDIEWYKNGKPKPHQKELSHKIRQCYKFFRKEIEQKALKDNNYCVNLWNDLNSKRKNLFIVIAVKPNENAQQIFDCINSAGVRLTIYDTIKNYIFEKLKNMPEITEEILLKTYNEKWNNIFETNEETIKFWTEIITLGRYKRDNAEMLLYCFAIINNIFDREKDVITDLDIKLKKHIDTLDYDGIINFLDKIDLYAKAYKEHLVLDEEHEYDFNDKISLLILTLKRFGATTFYPYVLKLLISNEANEGKNNKALVLLKLVLKVRLSTDEVTSKDYNKECYNIANEKAQNYKTIEQYYNERMNAGAITNEKVSTGLLNIGNNDATLVLFILELYRRSKQTGLDRSTLQFVYTLEHIMPQTYTRNWDINVIDVYSKDNNGNWGICNLSEEEKRQKRVSAIYEIGNMILLTDKLNEKNSCKPMDEKYPIINSFATNLILTREFIDIYNQTHLWNEQTINNRSNNLIQTMLNLLN